MAGPRHADAEARLLVQLTAGELERLIEDRVRATVLDAVSQLAEPRFLTVADVGEMLQVCTKTVHKLVRDDELPVARQLGRELRFERDRVVEWMRARGKGPELVPPTKQRLRQVK
jgi:excisionase family DNA binding protein